MSKENCSWYVLIYCLCTNYPVFHWVLVLNSGPQYYLTEMWWLFAILLEQKGRGFRGRYNGYGTVPVAHISWVLKRLGLAICWLLHFPGSVSTSFLHLRSRSFSLSLPPLSLSFLMFEIILKVSKTQWINKTM